MEGSVVELWDYSMVSWARVQFFVASQDYLRHITLTHKHTQKDKVVEWQSSWFFDGSQWPSPSAAFSDVTLIASVYRKRQNPKQNKTKQKTFVLFFVFVLQCFLCLLIIHVDHQWLSRQDTYWWLSSNTGGITLLVIVPRILGGIIPVVLVAATLGHHRSNNYCSNTGSINIS